MANKDRSIEHILDRGLVKPKTAREQTREILRAFGFRLILWDTAHSLIFAAITIAAVLTIFAAAPENYRYSATAAAAPLLYLLISVFTETAERASGLYELKHTCRYTARQITALRTACCSVAGAAYTAVIALIGARGASEFMAMFPLGLLSLFVCAVPQLALMRFARHKWASALYAAAWIFVNLAVPLRLGGIWEKTLAGIPIAVSLGIAAGGAAIAAHQIRKMLMEAKPYAYA
jgi:hypothetical protein